jgi:putative ABC transport system ATP-binding protein
MRTQTGLAPHAAPTGQAAASTRGLTRTYGRGETQVHALLDVDLDIPAGRFTAVMGPSGSGKSTLMHCLAGLDTPTAGTVTVAGVEVSGLGDNALTVFRRDHIGFVFQAFNLLPMLTAEQNVLLPLELAGRRPDPEWLDLVVDVLGIGDRMRHRPDQMSGGQQQRVALARGLVARPFTAHPPPATPQPPPAAPSTRPGPPPPPPSPAPPRSPGRPRKRGMCAVLRLARWTVRLPGRWS